LSMLSRMTTAEFSARTVLASLSKRNFFRNTRVKLGFWKPDA
jgi:hypothetical protein